MTVLNFRPEQYREAPSVLGGISNAQKVLAQYLQNQAAQAKNAVLPQSLQEQLRSNQLKNAIAEVQAQYAPQMAQAGLDYKQAQTPYLQAQTGNLQEKTKFIPEQFRILAQNAATREAQLAQSQNRFGPLYQVTRMLNNPVWLDLYNKNPKVAMELLNYGLSSIPNASDENGGSRSALETTEGLSGGEHPVDGSSKQLNETAAAENLGRGSQNQALINQNSNSPEALKRLNITPQQIQSTQDTAGSYKLRKTVPADIQKRIYAGERFNTSAQNAVHWWDKGAGNYFGVKGRLKLKEDEAKALKGDVSPDLIAYRNFLSAVENMNLQGAMLEGVPADQLSRGDYRKLFDLNQWANNKEAAYKKLQNSIDLAKSAENVNRESLNRIVTQPESVAQEAMVLPSMSAPKNQTDKSDRVRVRSPNGQMGTIPRDKLQAALKSGYSEVQ